jgi:excisionase family DNA binding protein
MGQQTTAGRSDDILNVEEAAQYLRMSPEWVYRASASGELPCTKLGRRTVFLRSELAAYVASLATRPKR